MKIGILSSAVSDLIEGRQFYEEQGEGLGEYFFDSLFSDIDSLALYAGGAGVQAFSDDGGVQLFHEQKIGDLLNGG
jgi:hypothetical protein